MTIVCKNKETSVWGEFYTVSNLLCIKCLNKNCKSLLPQKNVDIYVDRSGHHKVVLLCWFGWVKYGWMEIGHKELQVPWYSAKAATLATLMLMLLLLMMIHTPKAAWSHRYPGSSQGYYRTGKSCRPFCCMWPLDWSCIWILPHDSSW
jgi:hypothetical protein